MAIAGAFRVQTGAVKTIKSSSGDAAITLTSVANGSFRQAATLDLGATRAKAWLLSVAYEFAATPTAGNAVHHHASWYNTTGAGKAGTSGSDASYTGQSSNAAASVKALEYLGAFTTSALATSTVQAGDVGLIFPKCRYLNLVVENQSGAAFHSSASNIVITLTPIEDTVEAS